MIHTIEEFREAMIAPNTIHLEGATLAVMVDGEGMKMILRHGGDTLAMEFPPGAVDGLREALG